MKQPRTLAFAALCLYALASAIAGPNKAADVFASYSLGLVVCAWVLADARERGRKLWYDSDSILFFFWPALAPVYLFQTRGLRGFVPILIFVLIVGGSYATAFFLR